MQRVHDNPGRPLAPRARRAQSQTFSGPMSRCPPRAVRIPPDFALNRARYTETVPWGGPGSHLGASVELRRALSARTLISTLATRCRPVAAPGVELGMRAVHFAAHWSKPFYLFLKGRSAAGRFKRMPLATFWGPKMFALRFASGHPGGYLQPDSLGRLFSDGARCSVLARKMSFFR